VKVDGFFWFHRPLSYKKIVCTHNKLISFALFIRKAKPLVTIYM
jgi:hypothetical protein